jgi:hypothetical protein
MNLDDRSTTETAETGLELAMQELEPMEAPFWGTFLQGVSVGVAISFLAT